MDIDRQVAVAQSQPSNGDDEPADLSKMIPAAHRLGARLLRARIAQGYSVEQLSIACGLARSEILSIEAGECSNIAWIERMIASLAKGLLLGDEA